MSRVFNLENKSYLKQPMFFGDTMSVSRDDTLKYPKFAQLSDDQLAVFWRAEKHDVSSDKKQFHDMDEHLQRIFKTNLAYQILLDSVQSRTISAIIQFVSIPELEECLTIQSMFEGIHTQSYQHILKNALSINPSEVFDQVLLDPEIKRRAENIIKYYDDFLEYANLYKMFGECENLTIIKNGKKAFINLNKADLYRKLYLFLINSFLLESTLFYGSFLISFSFGENRTMIGNCSIISEIVRDESFHAAIFLNIINNYRKKEKDSLMLQIMSECKEEVLSMFESAYELEEIWSSYIFSQGSILGLNKEIYLQYIRHLIGNRLKNLGITSKYGKVTNPCTWVNKWMGIQDSEQSGFLVVRSPQEVQLVDYMINSIDNSNINFEKYKDFI